MTRAETMTSPLAPEPASDAPPGDAARGDAPLPQQILEEARRMLVEQGFQALSTRRIASAVGCTATSIYIYFRNKDALLHALIDEGMEELNRRLEAARTGPGTAAERVERVARAYLEFGFEHPCYYEVMFMLHPQHMERYPAESYRRARKNLETFGEVLAEASGSEFDLVAATTAWTAMHGHVALWIAKRTDASITREDFVEGAVGLIRRMVS